MSDLIDRQAAIDLFPDDALEWDTKGGYIAPHLAKLMIEELPSEQRWIPCSERMPNNYDYQLLTEEVHYTTGKIVRCVLIAYYDDEDDVWMSAEESPEAVSYPIAWMPLPASYKGE